MMGLGPKRPKASSQERKDTGCGSPPTCLQALFDSISLAQLVNILHRLLCCVLSLFLILSSVAGVGLICKELGLALVRLETSIFNIVQREGVRFHYFVFQNYTDMEESSNGKLEETKKEEVLAEETEVVIQGGGEGDESLKETVGDENSVDVEESPQNGDHTSSSSSSSSSDDDEESLKEKLESLEVFSPEKLKDEKEEGFESVEKSVVPLSEVVVDYIGVSDVTALESAVIKEQILPSMDENTGFSPAELDETTNETIISSVDGNIGESSSIADLVSEENVKNELQVNENSKESPGAVVLESKEYVDSLLQKPADVPIVAATSDINERNVESEIPASMINQPIISLASRTRHMTSWRSCCGLFDVLKRSNR